MVQSWDSGTLEARGRARTVEIVLDERCRCYASFRSVGARFRLDSKAEARLESRWCQKFAPLSLAFSIPLKI